MDGILNLERQDARVARKTVFQNVAVPGDPGALALKIIFILSGAF
jgi:hypothetical protein